jgi:GPH family glycoside/pentoside/hexuronide:cation symporter
VLADSNDLVLTDILKTDSVNPEISKNDSVFLNSTFFRLMHHDEAYISWFEIAGDDGEYQRARATLDSNKVTIISKIVTDPQRLRMAWSRTGPADEAEKEKNTFVYLLIMSLMFYTAVTIYSVPHGALGFEMTEDYHERTRIFAWASFIGNVGAISSPWLYALARAEIFTNEIQGIRFVCIGMGLILIISAVICAVTCREKNFHKIQKQQRVGLITSFKITLKNNTFIKLVIAFVLVIIGFQFVMGFSNFILIYYVFVGDKDAASVLMGWNGTVWAITGLVGVLPMSWISSKIGKKKTVIFSFSLLVIGQILKIVCYNQIYPWLTLIPTVLLSWGMVMCFSLVNSMNADICDEDELNTGTRREGSYFAVYGWWWKAAVSIAYVISGYLLQTTGYSADFGQQTVATLFWLRFWEIGLPAILSIIAIMVISRYPLTENRAYEIKELLKKGNNGGDTVNARS